MKSDKIKIDELKMQVLLALEEDIGYGDITTESLVPAEAMAKAEFVAKQDGVLAGIDAAKTVFHTLDPSVVFNAKMKDGMPFSDGDILAEIEGRASVLLKAERTALNFLQRLCGIATLTRRYVEAVASAAAEILDTRKTTPGWRLLEKYAVTCGGGRNHRMGLHDAVLIKENHIALAQSGGGSIKSAILAIRKKLGKDIFLEVETRNLEEVASALSAAPDCILLDNMSPAQMRQAVLLGEKSDGDILFEASGGVNLDSIAEIAKTGVHRISVGALTHSAPSADISMLLK